LKTQFGLNTFIFRYDVFITWTYLST